MAAAAVAASSGAFGQSIHVVVNGSAISFRNQQPIMQDDRVFVPLRGVFENLGASVNWDPSNQTVTAYRGHTKIQLTIGQTTASVDGQPVQLDVPAQILEGSTMVPLRFVGEALGNHVRWDANSQTVIISGEGGDFTPPPPPPPPGAPPIYMEAPGSPVWYPPVNWHRHDSIQINFGINIDWGHPHRGMPIECIVPHYPGLPPNTRVQGTVTNITTINNITHTTIVYNNIITPSGQRIPFQGHTTAAIPRGGGAPQSVSLTVDKPVKIGPPPGVKKPTSAPVRARPPHIVAPVSKPSVPVRTMPVHGAPMHPTMPSAPMKPAPGKPAPGAPTKGKPTHGRRPHKGKPNKTKPTPPADSKPDHG